MEFRDLDLEDISEKDFVAIMIDIMLYDDMTLVRDAFQLIIRFFSQRKELVLLSKET